MTETPLPASPAASPLIRLAGVTKRFGDADVLTDISLEIAASETVVICGPSGSGKSTLIRLINQLEEQTSGEISLDGRALASLSSEGLRALRGDVGFVFQQFNLFAHLTARRNITLPLTTVHGWSQADADARATELLTSVGLPDRADHYPDQLSGGQQQRVAIARALASRPRILLLDEPTSALDPEVIGEVLAVIAALARDGVTLIIVTHEMGFARRVANRMVFMDAGRILEIAPPEVFFTATVHPRARLFLDRVLSPLHGATDE